MSKRIMNNHRHNIQAFYSKCSSSSFIISAHNSNNNNQKLRWYERNIPEKGLVTATTLRIFQLTPISDSAVLQNTINLEHWASHLVTLSRRLDRRSCIFRTKDFLLVYTINMKMAKGLEYIPWLETCSIEVYTGCLHLRWLFLLNFHLIITALGATIRFLIKQKFIRLTLFM